MGIRIATEIETQSVRDGSNTIRRSLNDIDRAADRTEQNIGGLTTRVVEYSTAVTGIVPRQSRAAMGLNTLGASAATADRRFLQFQRGGAAQLSFQLQDIAVQAQQGTNGLIILAQQGTQIASLFGTAGALFGAVLAFGALLAGVLNASFADTTTATSRLRDAQESLNDIISISDTGVTQYADSILRLAQVNEQAARVNIALGIAEANVQIREGINLVSEAAEEYDSLTDNVTNFGDDLGLASVQLRALDDAGLSAADTINGLTVAANGSFIAVPELTEVVSELTDEFGLNQDQAITLARSYLNFNTNRTAESLQALANTTTALSNETNFANNDFVRFTAAVLRSSGDITQAQAVIDALNGGLEDFSTVATTATDSNTRLADQLAIARIRFNEGERAAVVYTAALSAAESGDLSAIATARQLAGELFDVNAARTQAADVARNAKVDNRALEALELQLVQAHGLNTRAIAEQTVVAKLSNTATDAQIQRARELAGAIFDQREQQELLNERQSAQTALQTLETDLSSNPALERIKQQEDARLQILQDARDTDIINNDEYLALLEQSQADSNRRRAELITNANAGALSASADLFSAAAQLSTSFAGDQENASSTALAISKGFALTASSLNLAVALGQALADPSALTLPQKFANYAAVAAAGGQLVSQITSLNLADGGIVTGPGSSRSDSIPANLSNGEFVVNARATARNRNTLEVMNRGGGVSTGGVSTGGDVIINNYTNSDPTVTTNEQGDIIVTIDERINALVPNMIGSEISNPNSRASRSLRTSYRVSRR